ncbi:MAG: YbaK/EbsC family protein [Thalassobaculum sp.]|uniref:YbaK/EbsC family protein n=1 Tax=Thalassobaculum sp. TaxID=2022740 RepID=UPI0032ECFB8F
MDWTDGIDSHSRLVGYLDAVGAGYRVVSHAAEGRSEEISVIRGNHPSQALKAMVVALKNAGTDFGLAVLPGDRRVDFDALARAFGARKVRFAAPEDAQRLTGCVMGSVPPFSFHPAVPLVADPSIQINQEVCFNAARLDRSIFMPLADYLKAAEPRLAAFAA